MPIPLKQSIKQSHLKGLKSQILQAPFLVENMLNNVFIMFSIMLTIN